MPKGMVTAFFLSTKCAFECIVKRVFGSIDIYMTHKLGFTLSLESKFFTFFLHFASLRAKRGNPLFF